MKHRTSNIEHRTSNSEEGWWWFLAAVVAAVFTIGTLALITGCASPKYEAVPGPSKFSKPEISLTQRAQGSYPDGAIMQRSYPDVAIQSAAAVLPGRGYALVWDYALPMPDGDGARVFEVHHALSLQPVIVWSQFAVTSAPPVAITPIQAQEFFIVRASNTVTHVAGDWGTTRVVSGFASK